MNEFRGQSDTTKTNPGFEEVVNLRFGRRDALRGALAAAALAALPPVFRPAPAKAETGAGASPAPFSFTEISRGVDGAHHVAPGYAADVFLRWGDPITPAAPPFDPRRQTAAAQELQFGYNCDYIGFVPLGADRGLLCVNHEYTIPRLMFPGLLNADGSFNMAAYTPQMADIELAAHGVSVVEVKRRGAGWEVVPDSMRNRRITTRSTPFLLTGPAAGHPRLQTKADPRGRHVIGTLNNCAGGVTPWGTYLSGEENFDGYFGGRLPEGHPEARAYFDYGIGARPSSRFALIQKRFDVSHEPNEANRFGWVVEIDPHDPTSTPKKRTALGRFKHEGAETVLNKDGRVVLYSGDDEVFQYIYKFVTKGRFNPSDRAANMDLLDEGTLYAARLEADGTLHWLPLVHGHGPLTAANGFESQADVLIEARRAATLLGATPMDRPEDVQPHPTNGRVYAMLTNNARRHESQVDAANPRARNAFGHIVEMIAPDADHAADVFRWEILLRCGDPSVATVGATYNPATSANGWFGSPDNGAIDVEGRLWVATDQGSNWPLTGSADGLYAIETEGDGRATSRMFFRVPVGAEMCGPCFAPDGRALFLSVQHPGADGTASYPGFERASTFEDPATRWPDFKPDTPPRPSVVLITRNDGGRIGG